jgi:hypothetical protein
MVPKRLKEAGWRQDYRRKNYPNFCVEEGVNTRSRFSSYEVENGTAV